MYPFTASYVFAVFTVAVAISKLVRLAAYFYIVPLASFLLLFPTFWVADISAICITRLLLWQPARGSLANLAFCVALFMTILTTLGAAAQVGFFLKTGTELDWSDAPAFVANKNSIVVLLSGSWRVLTSASFLLTLAYFVHQQLYRAFGALNNHIGKGAYYAISLLRSWTSRTREPLRKSNVDESEAAKLLTEERESAEESHELDFRLRSDNGNQADADRNTRRLSSVVSLIVQATLVVITLIGCLLRPSRPYSHMSTTLPASLAVVLKPGPTYCTEQRAIFKNNWPLPELIDKGKWKRPKGNFKGWAPGAESELAERYRKWTPSWIPQKVPRGFARWDPQRLSDGDDEDAPEFPGPHPPRPPHPPHPPHIPYPPHLPHPPRGPHERHGPPGPPGHHGHRGPHPPPPPPCGNLPVRESSYNPVDDPLRITNLDEDILEPIKGALSNGSVRIKHVVYILMESLRSEFFPLQQGSEIHKAILALSPKGDRLAINEKLAYLTPHIERITGVKGGFHGEDGLPYPAPELMWNETTDSHHGGINVIGSYTAATMSTKSFAVNHCGAWAMPVETFDEAATDSYQPCMPQILNLWSDLKDDEAVVSGDFRDQKWYPALFESMVEAYDRQEIFDQKVGFKHIVTRENLEREPDFDKSDPKYQKVNYFGFAEQVLKPHIKDYIANALANKQRIWMTHFTSTTHHAWKTPDWFDTTDYMPTGLSSLGHRYFNRYLNTIRFHDAWMGELMQLLEDSGIANETLVVFAGDHGMAFHEDDGQEGTYGNAHISNLRIPITFRHPHLPNVQYHVNATTISTLPTILDLLIHSGSLNTEDTAIASDLVHEYEGQSLLRPYKSSEDGRRAWNFAVINSGGKMLVVTSADAPWLLVIPFGKVFPYRFADISSDPLELDPIISWTIEDVMQAAEARYGAEAATWAREAELVGKWWSTERKRLWKHHSGGPPR